jgi:hypothetical protein
MLEKDIMLWARDEASNSSFTGACDGRRGYEIYSLP